MKKMKKLLSMALVCMMALSMVTSAFAADPILASVGENKTNGEEITDGTITISSIHTNAEGNVDTTYEIYKMLHLQSYDADDNAYSYVIVNEWEEFFTTGDGAAYISINNAGYVNWKTATDDVTVNNFAKAALKYAGEKKIAPVKSTRNNTDYTLSADKTAITFSGLTLGYYLIDSNVGALCGLTTTNPNGSITAKNGEPTLEKKVQEDSAVGTGTNSWYDSNTADIGQYVNYDVTINVHAGAQSYVFHDKMSEGLTFVHGTIDEEKHGILGVIHNKTADNQQVTLVENTHYTVVINPDDYPKDSDETKNCTFHIVFAQDFCDSLKTNDKIYITYDAKLNDKAKVGTEGNPNTAWLDYGEGHKTVTDQTVTYTYGFDLIKTNSATKLIDGATFQIYTQETGGDPVMLAMRADGTYRKATKILTEEGERAVENNIIAVTGGKIWVEGFDNGTYYLQEVVAPDGYNKLTARVPFTISDSNLTATLSDDGQTYIGGGVRVQNSTGTVLPETGAKGTAMFIGFGAALVIGTGLLLVTKKRMSMIED